MKKEQVLPLSCFIVLLAVLVFAGFGIRNSDWFQRKYHPETYWAEQASKYESSIRYFEAWISNAKIEMQQAVVNSAFELQKEINVAESMGVETEGLKGNAKAILKDEVEELEREIVLWEDMLKTARQGLEEAKKYSVVGK